MKKSTILCSLIIFSLIILSTSAEAQDTFSFQKSGTGTGTVTITDPNSGAGWVCNDVYTEGTYPYQEGSSLQFEAVPASGSVFGGWQYNDIPVNEITYIAPGDTITALFQLETPPDDPAGSEGTLELQTGTGTSVSCPPQCLSAQEMTNPLCYDTVLYERIDGASITIKKHGQFTSADGTTFYTVPADVAVSFASSGISQDADTFYYIWAGEREDDCTQLDFLFSTDPYNAPATLVHPRRIRGGVRTDSSGNILPFYLLNDWYFYDAEIPHYAAHAGQTCLSSTTLPINTITDINAGGLHGFVPEGARLIEFQFVAAQGMYYFRPKGIANWNCVFPNHEERLVMAVSDMGEFQVRAYSWVEQSDIYLRRYHLGECR